MRSVHKVISYCMMLLISILPTMGGGYSMISEVYNQDCLEYMKSIPDNFFSICVADPPYGINASKMTMGSGKNKQWTKKDWDGQVPSDEVFSEIMRVSKNQIIWGGNYFSFLPPTKSWIVWDKGIYGDCSFADGELAWTSFDKVLRIAQIRYKGFLGMDKNRIHPTQKPIKLYQWIFEHYTNEGDIIFDPFLGSGSSRIAAYKMGLDFYACELDKEYFDKQQQRFEEECFGIIKSASGQTIQQTSLFE